MKCFRKCFLLIFFIFSNLLIYSQEKYSVFSYKSNWWHGNSKGGDIVVKIEIFEIVEDIVEFQLFCKWENISGVINSRIIARKNNDFYDFTFIDDYGNKCFGHISFKEMYVDLFFDCYEYSEIGKNFRRLYGKCYELTKYANQ